MKDNAQETIGNYNGNARPGEIVADLTQDPPALFIGNNLGQLTPLSSGGGGYGNTQVAQFLTAGVVGNIIPAGNGVNSLGNSTNYWANLWVAGNTLYIGGVPVGMLGNTLTVNGQAVLSNSSNTSISTTGNITAGNISTGIITLTNGATIRDTVGNSVAIGLNAGATTQGTQAVAIGNLAGNSTQGNQAVAIGPDTGNTTQGTQAVAIGSSAGSNVQGNNAIAIGRQSGFDNQGIRSVAIGTFAGAITQGNNSVAIGINAGLDSQGANSVAIGNSAGQTNQGANSIAIGPNAGLSNQSNNSIIINATGASLNQTVANTFTVAPVRNDVANVAEVMFYNTTSKEITYGNVISVAGNVTGGNILTGGNVTATRVQNDSNLEIRSNVAGTARTWTFDAIGDLNLPLGRNITGSGNINIGNVNLGGLGDGNITSDGNIIVKSGTFPVTFDNTGNVTVAGNLTVSGTAGNVATKSSGAWTVPTGNSTQSFTVDPNNTYQMWVEGNIPNGIIAWNATVTITNINVPVLGQQFAWNYEGAGNPLMITSIPDQIIGTAGAISNAAPAVANTNVFSFGINNASGNTVSVRYGWIQIST